MKKISITVAVAIALAACWFSSNGNAKANTKEQVENIDVKWHLTTPKNKIIKDVYVEDNI